VLVEDVPQFFFQITARAQLRVEERKKHTGKKRKKERNTPVRNERKKEIYR
jgi:hypothetical protein